MSKLALTSFIDSGSPAMSRAGDYAGKTRIDIVYEKIDKQLPFIIGPKKEGEKVYGVNFTSNTFVMVGLALAGGSVGGYYGSQKLNSRRLEYFLALVLTLAGIKLVLF